MAEKTVTVKFDGQSHQVEINTFTQVLLDYSTVVQAAADEAGLIDPIRISITATEPGSLDAIITVMADAAAGALNFLEDYQNGLGAAVTIAGGLYGLKRKLAGKDKVEVTETSDDFVTLAANGDIIIIEKPVYNLYRNHPEATNAIDSSFSALEENPAITGFEMSSEGQVVFRAERDEFSAIASSPNHENDNYEHSREDVWLTVVKPYLAFSKTRKWEFVYAGNKITAPIVDDDFFESLESYVFQVGTKMHVELDILKEYDDTYRVFMNKKYTVIRVIEVENQHKTEPFI